MRYQHGGLATARIANKMNGECPEALAIIEALIGSPRLCPPWWCNANGPVR